MDRKQNHTQLFNRLERNRNREETWPFCDPVLLSGHIICNGLHFVIMQYITECGHSYNAGTAQKNSRVQLSCVVSYFSGVREKNSCLLKVGPRLGDDSGGDTVGKDDRLRQ